jgi:putative hydrolase of the HAD superfamily
VNDSDLHALDAVFLDAGGVLVDPNWERVAAAMRAQGIDVAAAALAAAEPAAKRELDVPYRIQTTDDRSRCGFFWELVATHAGVHAAPEQLVRAWAELDAYHAEQNLWEVPLPGVPEALAALRARGLRLVVVSNANGTLRKKLDRLDLARHFDVILDSHVVGVEKPDRRIFEIALEAARVEPGAAVHVGDLYEVDVVGARAAGVAAVLVDPTGLQNDRDCPRVSSLAAFATHLLGGS